MSREALHHSRIWGNTLGISVSEIYDEYRKEKTWRRRPFTCSRLTLYRRGISHGEYPRDLRVRNLRWDLYP
ncbi:hypothetical protein N665_0117s0018 [Sinapis alba]|nr:hypothetical protein N665_0117s0018 [Sinapis alba]